MAILAEIKEYIIENYSGKKATINDVVMDLSRHGLNDISDSSLAKCLKSIGAFKPIQNRDNAKYRTHGKPFSASSVKRRVGSRYKYRDLYAMCDSAD